MFKNAFQKKLHQRFYVTPKEGIHFSGVLIHAERSEDGHCVFADVKAHVQGREPEPAQGELYMPNRNIAYVQLMPVVPSVDS